MSKFGIKYCFDNPKSFKNSDTAHILSFSIIMLNTDLHSSSISRKMSLRDFVKNNKPVAVDEDADFEERLKGIYSRIAAEEIKMDNKKEDKASKITPKSFLSFCNFCGFLCFSVLDNSLYISVFYTFVINFYPQN